MKQSSVSLFSDVTTLVGAGKECYLLYQELIALNNCFKWKQTISELLQVRIDAFR